jgi:hypothetical protein
MARPTERAAAGRDMTPELRNAELVHRVAAGQPPPAEALRVQAVEADAALARIIGSGVQLRAGHVIERGRTQGSLGGSDEARAASENEATIAGGSGLSQGEFCRWNESQVLT